MRFTIIFMSNVAVMLQAGFTIAVYTTVSTTIYKNKRFNIY